jgi:hypothetical protein
MKHILYIALSLFLTACADKPADLKTVEGLSDYIFNKKFPAIATDASLLKLYTINKVKMEGDEGAVWDSYEFYLRSKLAFTVENNWESKTWVHRMMFMHPEIKTKEQIYGTSPFKNIRHLIDTIKLNHAPDGYLFFFDARNPCMTYYFELPENSTLVHGISSLDEVPDNLKIEAIIIMRECN